MYKQSGFAEEDFFTNFAPHVNNKKSLRAARRMRSQKNSKNKKQEICGNRIEAGFFNVIIQDIAVHGTND